MELIKELPEVFEEFAEQRKNSFLAVKEAKEKGIPVVGSYCTYFPKELPMAIGAAAVSLCSMSGETIEVAEQDLPKNLCPLIKASYGFAKTDKCPYFYFSDLIVGETTCDGKKKMYELMSQFKDVYVMQLPQSQDERGRKFWRESCLELKRKLEEKFGTVITDEAVRQAVHTENGVRRALQRFYGVMKHDPAPITGLELFRVLYGSTFKLDRSSLADELNALTDKIEAEYENVKYNFNQEESGYRIVKTYYSPSSNIWRENNTKGWIEEKKGKVYLKTENRRFKSFTNEILYFDKDYKYMIINYENDGVIRVFSKYPINKIMITGEEKEKLEKELEKIEDMRTLYDVTYNPEMKNPKDEINRSKIEQEERAEKIEKQLMEDYDNFFKIN